MYTDKVLIFSPRFNRYLIICTDGRFQGTTRWADLIRKECDYRILGRVGLHSYIYSCIFTYFQKPRGSKTDADHTHTRLWDFWIQRTEIRVKAWLGGTVGPKVEMYACVRVSVLGGEGRDQFFENLGSDRQKST